jgi:GxxExxY protein
MMDIQHLCDEVRQTAYDIHVYLGNGHFEKVYENALAHRLKEKRIMVSQQHPIKVFDIDGFVLGEYCADLFVENQLIVELKVANVISDAHVGQILGYMRATKIRDGLLINFGAQKFQIRKFII